MTDKKRYDLNQDREFEPCPTCGMPLKTWHEADGPDDYVSKASCENCGEEFSE